MSKEKKDSLPSIFDAKTNNVLDTLQLGDEEDQTLDSEHNFFADSLDKRSFYPEKSSRYLLGTLLGKGGMGEVYEATDIHLDRVVAFKLMQGKVTTQAVNKFIEEAKITAKLQHAGVVPIYDIGKTADNNMFFTMKKVVGVTLRDIIKEVHELPIEKRWNSLEEEWSIYRLLSLFLRVCETLAYVHMQDVLHLDIKPSNIMISEHGEVFIVDWGLAKVLSEEQEDQGIVGTPAYMAPEQAEGLREALNPSTDVYALGTILYLILSGHKPYKGSPKEIIQKLRSEDPISISIDSENLREKETLSMTRDPSIPTIGGHTIPKRLIDICDKAMQRQQNKRYQSATEIAKAIRIWLEGSQKRSQALRLVETAQQYKKQSEQLKQSAEERKQRALLSLEELENWAPEENKIPFWEQLDTAENEFNQVQDLLLKHESMLRGALGYVSDLEKAHLALAEYYLELHREAELSNQSFLAQQRLHQLKDHVSFIQLNQPKRRELEGYLKGDGVVSLSLREKKASVQIYKYETYHRRFVPKLVHKFTFEQSTQQQLTMGSYLLEIHVEDKPMVRYPVYLEREQIWDGVDPETGANILYIPSEIEKDCCYIPAGWTIVGGDDSAVGSLTRRRVWIDGFVIMKYHVTNKQFIAFLNDLVQRKGEAEAFLYVPREPGTEERPGAMIYGYEAGEFFLQPDEDGDIMGDDWPVCMVHYPSVIAYAAWLSEKTGKKWRPPHEFEWEKAARGVDGRFFPWGNGFDPTWCNMRASLPNYNSLPVSIKAFHRDESPYGIRHCAGNMCEWTSTPYKESGPLIEGEKVTDLHSESDLLSFRGGSWINWERFTRASSRFRTDCSSRFRSLGFRLGYSIEE